MDRKTAVERWDAAVAIERTAHRIHEMLRNTEHYELSREVYYATQRLSDAAWDDYQKFLVK